MNLKNTTVLYFKIYCVLYWTRNRNLAYFRFSEWWHRCLVYPVILVFVAVTTHFQGNFFFYIASSASNIYKFLFLIHMAPIFQRIFIDKKYSSIPKCFEIWVAVMTCKVFLFYGVTLTYADSAHFWILLS